jgi:glycolate oxidase
VRSAVLDPGALADLAAILRPDQLIRELEQLRTYECDGLMRHRVVPAAVAIPETAAEVQAVVRVCNAHKIPFVARGAGTGL